MVLMPFHQFLKSIDLAFQHLRYDFGVVRYLGALDQLFCSLPPRPVRVPCLGPPYCGGRLKGCIQFFTNSESGAT
jgi:hypothetical protein